VDVLRTKGYTRVLDLSGEEAGGRGRFLEGTGVLVLDRINGTAYVSLSDRADRVRHDLPLVKTLHDNVRRKAGAILL
jgi:hypothetical protein